MFKKFKEIVLLLGFGLLLGLLGSALGLFWPSTAPKVEAQSPVVELDCPVGQQPLPGLVARNLSTDALRRYACADPSGVIGFNQILSTSANRAQSGVVRLATGDAILWRNFSNTADVGLTKTPGDNYVFSQGIIPDGGINPAQSGGFRLNSTDFLSWRNQANNGDIALAKNTSDQLVVGIIINQSRN